MQGAWKVGLLVIVFVALLVVGYAILGNSLFGAKEKTYYATFQDAGGVTVGTPVLMAGVKIGDVQAIALESPQLAKLTLGIDQKIQIPRGSMAQIQTAMIGLGQQPITIVPPIAASAPLPVGSTLSGIHTSAIESFLPEAKTTVKELNKTLAAARSLLEDQKLRGGIEKLLATTSQTATNFQLVALHADALLGQNQAAIHSAVLNASKAMADIQKSTALVAKFAQDQRWKDQIGSIMSNLDATSSKAQTLVENLNAFVTDPKLRQPLNQTVANTAQITETGTRVAKNAEVMSQNGITITKKAIELEDEAKSLAKDAKGVLDKLGGFFGHPNAKPFLGGITGNLDLIRESRPGHTRTDVNFTLPIGSDNLHFGLYDAFESNKINAEIGKPFNSGSEWLYGIYASKPAVGVDFHLAPRLYLRGDVFDINHPRGDIRARVEFGNGFYGWLGVEDLFKNNAPMIGLGFKK